MLRKRIVFTGTVLLTLVSTLSQAEVEAPPIQAKYPLSRITDHVYIIHGPRAFPTKANQGFMNNPAFVITGQGVVIVDPGSSVQVGKMVLKKVAEVTKAPVVAVFNTHVHGDHWLGNQAIKTAYPNARIYGHAGMIKKIKAGDGEVWVQRMARLSEGATRGTRAVEPGYAVKNGDVISIGEVSFRVHHYGKAHTDNDILIEVPERGVTFLGDNVVAGVLTRMDDSDIKGQIETVRAALQLKTAHFIPGHGPSGGREIVHTYLSFLETLRGSVKKYFDEGLSDFEMKPKVINELATFKDWARFEVLGRSINLVFLQVESESF